MFNLDSRDIYNVDSRLSDAADHSGFILLIVRRKDSNNWKASFPGHGQFHCPDKIIAISNILTDVCFQRMASHLASAASGKTLFTHLALGDGDALAESEDNLSLENEIYRAAFDNIFASGAAIFGYSEIIATDIGLDSYTIEEVGLYDASAGGNLIARALLGDNVIEDFAGADQLDTLWGIVSQ